MSVGVCFAEKDRMPVIVLREKSVQLVLATLKLTKNLGLLIKISSVQVGFFGFLK